MELSQDALQGKRILVVEDLADNMRLMRAILQLADVRMLEATAAVEGLEIAARELPDLVLMDIHMPGMDGLEATRRLRANPATAHLPVIAVTASVMAEEREKIREAGCDDCIAKPLEPLQFLGRLQEFFAARPQTAG